MASLNNVIKESNGRAGISENGLTGDFRSFYENAPCGMFRSSLDGKFLMANQALADLLGFESPDFMVSCIRDIDEDLFLGTGEYAQIVSLAEVNERPVTGEFQVLCSDGSLIWVEIRAMAVLDEQEERSAIEGYVTDITEQKRCEWLLKEKDEIFKGIYDHSIEGLFQCTPEGRLVSGSPSFADCFGFKDFDELSSLWPGFEDIFESRQTLDELYRCIEREGYAKNFEARAKKKGGDHVWVSINARVQNDGDGRPVLFQGSINEITERKSVENKLDYQSAHDVLTGLMNRSMFAAGIEKALARAVRNKGYSFAVIFADLDRFKIINDSLGYEIGDRALVDLGERIRQVLRTEDTLARLGNDQFGILVEGARQALDAIRVAERVLKACEKPFVIDGNEIFLNMSMGIVFGTEKTKDAGKMLADAEQAMTKAKKNPHHRYVVLDECMHNMALERLCLETDLRKGLDRDEFKLFYQPIVDLESGLIMGLEALLRWDHPLRKMVSPSEFIPVAEETGLIIPLGNKVLEKACEQMRKWSEKFAFDQPIIISVNLSAKQFMKSDLVEDIERVLEKSGLAGSSLKLEITESAVMAEPETAISLLQRLKGLGVMISIDDFGTGYSSLSYLKHLPSDCLKIDRSFISDIEVSGDNRAIAETIVALSKSLGKSVIAEGIEKAEHWRILTEMGCGYGQGFYFSPPVDAAKAEKFLLKRFSR